MTTGRLLADERVPVGALGDGSNSTGDLTEFLPMENPMPKKIAHRITSPKNNASILPVPSVISVSVVLSTLLGLIRVALTGVIKLVGY
jgi:hypothetical protein